MRFAKAIFRTLTVMNISLSRASGRAEVSPAPRPSPGVKPLVLVVEDHEDTRFMLEYLLERRGCQVAMAEDGEDAVCVAEKIRPDLILMDATLPRLDGLAVMRRIRELTTLHDVPIVFLSCHAQPEFRAEALARGGNDYITKPFAIDELESVVERHLSGKPDDQA